MKAITLGAGAAVVNTNQQQEFKSYSQKRVDKAN